MASDPRPAIQLAGIGLTFPGQTTAVIEGLDLSIAPGEFVTIVGPSGCGKTTLLRLVHGLIAPTRGRVTASGEPVVRPDRRTSFVFQSDNLLPWRKVIDNVGYPLELAGVNRRDARERARSLLELTGLSGSEDKFPSQMSGGMRQRVNLARALAPDPDVLLMDEPFAALDAQTREVMQSELLTLWARDRKTVVFVTHQLDEAVYLADRVIVLEPHPGRVRADIRIDLPRPRDLEVKRTPEFGAYVGQLWDLIKAAVMSDART